MKKKPKQSRCRPCLLDQKQDLTNVSDGISKLKKLIVNCKTGKPEKNCFFLFLDVAIGAPQEDDLKGAIYIYNGRRDGISPAPSQVPTDCFFLFLARWRRTETFPLLSSTSAACLQRITGSTLGRHLKMFGQSLSSGIDVDLNGYRGNSSRRRHK